MSRITLTELITLAKAGYTPDKVKELLTLDSTPAEPAPAEDIPAEDTPAPSVSAKNDEAVNTNPAPAENEELIKLRVEMETLKAQLAEAQNANRHVDVSNNTSTLEQEMDNLFRAFM